MVARLYSNKLERKQSLPEANLRAVHACDSSIQEVETGGEEVLKSVRLDYITTSTLSKKKGEGEKEKEEERREGKERGKKKSLHV